MSIVTHKEFSILCGMPSEGNVRVNISRGKIVTLADDKGLIDTDNPINLIFKQNYKPKAKSQPPPTAPSIETLYKEVVQVEEKPKRKTSTKKELDQAEEMLSWDARKKRADALKAESSAEKEALAVQKMMGQLMPTELVGQILTINIKNIFKEFEAGSLNIASTYCDIMANGDRTLLGEVTDKLRFLLEDVIKRSKEVAEIEIENAINEYAETRSRGERK